jgi:hypothetical protein
VTSLLRVLHNIDSLGEGTAADHRPTDV